MNIFKSKEGYKACLAPKELAQLLITRFFMKIFSVEELKDKPYNSQHVRDYISKLAKDTVDSKEYEYYAAILDLYQAFSKDCNFCFNLNNSYNPAIDNLKNLDDLEVFKDDPPDVIVMYKNIDYPFELKRYRGKVIFKDLYVFIKNKIILHYSGKNNFLILLQPEKDFNIDLRIFKEIHDKLKKEKNQPGYIGFSFNNDNKEIITIRVLPKLEKYVRQYTPETNTFLELLNS